MSDYAQRFIVFASSFKDTLCVKCPDCHLITRFEAEPMTVADLVEFANAHWYVCIRQA